MGAPPGPVEPLVGSKSKVDELQGLEAGSLPGYLCASSAVAGFAMGLGCYGFVLMPLTYLRQGQPPYGLDHGFESFVLLASSALWLKSRTTTLGLLLQQTYPQFALLADLFVFLSCAACFLTNSYHYMPLSLLAIPIAFLSDASFLSVTGFLGTLYSVIYLDVGISLVLPFNLRFFAFVVDSFFYSELGPLYYDSILYAVPALPLALNLHPARTAFVAFCSRFDYFASRNLQNYLFWGVTVAMTAMSFLLSAGFPYLDIIARSYSQIFFTVTVAFVMPALFYIKLAEKRRSDAEPGYVATVSETTRLWLAKAVVVLFLVAAPMGLLCRLVYNLFAPGSSWSQP
jgi:hypothetical protein